MRALQAIIDRLEAQGLGAEGTTIFAGADVDLPSGPGPFLTLIETGGAAPLATHSNGTVRQPAFQITARADQYPDAAALADAAYLALGGGAQPLANLQIGDVFFLRVKPIQEPFQLPIDANGRARLVFNINTQWR